MKQSKNLLHTFSGKPPLSLQMFIQLLRHVPFLKPNLGHVSDIVDTWRSYKLSVPTFGAIILNSTLTKILLVQSWSGQCNIKQTKSLY